MPNQNDNKKIKIVYLIGQLGLGGSERQLYLLLKHFDPSKMEAFIIVFNPSPNVTLNNAIENLGVRVFLVPPDCRGITPRLIYVYRLLRHISPHIVHSWTIHDNPYAGIAGWLAGVPLRWGSARDSILVQSFETLPLIYKWLSLFSVQKMIVNSQPIAGELVNKGVQLPRISVLPNGVELPATYKDKESIESVFPGLEILIGKRVVGLVGNLRGKKNHFMFIDGMKTILQRHPDVYGVIVGQPLPSEENYHQALQKRVSDPALNGQVILAGFQENVPALMRQFSVFCLTSDAEGTPNVILEAMAASLPVVATHVGGIPALVQDGINGFLVAPGDVKGFARAVNQLLANPELAQRMGQAGLELVKHNFSCDKVARQLEKIYHSAVFGEDNQ